MKWNARVVYGGEKEYNNGLFKNKWPVCACLMRYVRSGMRFTLSQERIKPRGFGCTEVVHIAHITKYAIH